MARPPRPRGKPQTAPTAPAQPIHVEMARQYVSDVLDGTILACRWVKLACQRWRDDEAREADPSWPYRHDDIAAERVCRFIELQTHPRGEWAGRGETIRLEPWQCFIVVSVFGQVQKADGLRRFRNAMVLVPRKNGKSALSSALGLYMLAADGEHSAEVYCGATSEKQAWEIFRGSRDMALGNAQMRSRYGMHVAAKSISIPKTGSRFAPVIGKPGDGSSPSFAMLDEAHEHDTSDLRDTMVTGFLARTQPLLWTITTAGDNVAGPCFDDALTGRAILEGTIRDERRFYIEWTIDADVDWTSPEALRMANPNFGISIKIDTLLDEQKAAIRNTRDQGRFKTKHLNLWVSAKSAFFNMERWAQSYDPTITPESLKGERCTIGIDIAAIRDIAAIQLLFPRDGGDYATFGKYYLPEDVIRAPGNEHYAGWTDQGLIIETEGNMTDLSRLYDDLLELIATYQVQEIVFDPSQAAQMQGDLSNIGVLSTSMHQSPANLHAPMYYLAALIDSGKLRHSAGQSHPLTWQMSNVVVKPGYDRQKPSKLRDSAKIDAAAAMIMAMAKLMVDEQPEESVYKTRGLLYI